MDNKGYTIPSLGKSRLRDDLLGLLFTNSQREYYLRELERVLGQPVANLSKELGRLETIGLVKSRRLGNLKLFAINEKNGLFREMKAIVQKTVGLPNLLRLALTKVERIEAAAIYGSFAQGAERADSDVDLLIVGSCSDSEIIKAIKPLEKELDREINYTLYSSQEWAYKLRDKDSFIQHVLKGKLIMLQGKLDAKGFD